MMDWSLCLLSPWGRNYTKNIILVVEWDGASGLVFQRVCKVADTLKLVLNHASWCQATVLEHQTVGMNLNGPELDHHYHLVSWICNSCHISKVTRRLSPNHKSLHCWDFLECWLGLCPWCLQQQQAGQWRYSKFQTLLGCIFPEWGGFQPIFQLQLRHLWQTGISLTVAGRPQPQNEFAGKSKQVWILEHDE